MLDKETVLSNVRMLLGLTTNDKDSLISLLIDKAEQDIKVFCNNSFEVNGEYQFPDELQSVLEDIVIYRYQRLGAEAFQQESMGNKSVTYTTDIPNDIKARLYPFRKMRVW